MMFILRVFGLARIFALLIVLFATAVHAEQLSFRKSLEPTLINFDYRWLDLNNTTQNLSFTLPKKIVYKQKHTKFVPELAQNFVFIELLKAAREIDPREARIEIQQVAQDIRVTVKSRSAKLMRKWQISMQTKKQQAFDKYLEQNYYAYFKTPFGQQGFKPDHLRYIDKNKQELLPVATAIFEMLSTDSNPVQYVNLILSWVQNIPYNALENRLESNGAGYLPPLSVIANNQGDCDSKTTLTATIIRALLPDAKMVMVYLPKHALLGLSLPQQLKKDTFLVEGIDYLLMEPTGPASLPLGEIGTTSENQMASGMYSYEKIP
ncbi:MAG: hypothetical protein ACI88A_002175 [Paraglaciecola sp.]|jgi:hypothetical protein